MGEQKKPTWRNANMALRDVGLLVNKPPGDAEVPFFKSSEVYSRNRRRFPVDCSLNSRKYRAWPGRYKNDAIDRRN